MSNLPNDDTVSKAIGAARNYLSPDDAAKIEKIARNRDALRGLTAGLSDRDWANVMQVMNDPALLRKVLTSPQGQAGLRDILKRIP